MLQVTRVPFAEETKAYSRRVAAEELPISGGRWYRFDVEGESPVVSGLIWLRVRDDWPGRCTPLSVKLRLTFWGPVGLKHSEPDAQLRELGAKAAQRLLERRVHDD